MPRSLKGAFLGSGCLACLGLVPAKLGYILDLRHNDRPPHSLWPVSATETGNYHRLSLPSKSVTVIHLLPSRLLYSSVACETCVHHRRMGFYLKRSLGPINIWDTHRMPPEYFQHALPVPAAWVPSTSKPHKGPLHFLGLLMNCGGSSSISPCTHVTVSQKRPQAIMVEICTMEFRLEHL